MKINTRIGIQKRGIARSYKRRAFIALATFGMLAGFVSQTFTSVLFQYNNAFATAGWNWVAQSPSQADNIVDFGNLENKAASKDGSVIMYGTTFGIKISRDGGDTWTTYHPNPNKYYEFFTGVAMSANGQHMWVEAGYTMNSLTFMSHDGGHTWTQTGDDTESAGYCEYLGFVSNDGQTVVCNGVVSRDGGQTYDYLDYTPTSVSDTLQVMVSEDSISTDTGVTWNQFSNFPAYNQLDWSATQVSSNGQVIAVGVYDSEIYTTERIVSGYEIVISEDGGANWETRSLPGAFENPAFKMSRNGQVMYLFDYNATLGGSPMYTSTDKGETWQARATGLPYYVSGYADLWISDSGSVLTAFTYSAATFRSEDGGATWGALVDRGGVNPVTLSTDGSKIYGVVSLGGRTSSSGLLLPVISTNNGETWKSLYGDNLASIQTTFQTCTPDKYYGDASTQLSVSADGQTLTMPGSTMAGADCYLLSKDGGTNWQTITGPVGKAFYAKVLISKTGQHLAVKSSGNKVMLSHDGGVTWTTPASAFTFREVQSISNDGQKLTATTTSNVLLYSVNGGTSWTNVGTVISSAYTGVYGSDWRASVSGDGSRLIASDSGSEYAYFSTNNGANWTRSTSTVSVDGGVSSYSYNTWYIGQFSMSENGMRIGVTGDDGTALTSLDGGVTFSKQDTLEGTNMLWEMNTLMSADGSTLLVADAEAYFGLAKYGFNPLPAQNVTAVAGVEEATISWALPTLQDPSDSVIAQEVRYRTVGSISWTTASQAISPTATSYTVTGLTGGQQYEFQVRAQNTLGGWTPWARAFAPLTSIDISDIAPDGSLSSEYALDANDDGEIWFAHDYYPCGDPGSCAQTGWMLQHSSDGGLTWQMNTMPGTTAGTQLTSATPHGLRVSNDGQTILVTGTTMYLSRDGGATWNNVTSIGAGRWFGIDMSTNGTYMVASEWGGARQVKVSSDGGLTWVTRTLPYGQDAGDVATIRIYNDGAIYASTYDGNQPIVRSTDLGVTWQPASDSLPRSLPTPNTSYEYILDGRIGNLALVNISDDGQKMTYAASYGTRATNSQTVRYVTEDGGENWLALSPLTDNFAFDPEMLGSEDWYYDYSPAFTASGRSAYITGIESGGNYHIMFSNFSTAFATPTAAPATGGSGSGSGGAGGGSTDGSGAPGAPNTGVFAGSVLQGRAGQFASANWGYALILVAGIVALVFAAHYSYRRRS